MAQSKQYKIEMKILSFSILLLLLNIFPTHGQDSTQHRHIVFKVRFTNLHSANYAGFLATMDDSAIYVSAQILKFSFAHTNVSDLQKFGYQELGKVQIQRKNSVGRGFLFGAISSFAAIEIYILATAGQQSVYNFNSTEKTIFFAIPGAILGGLIGMTIGALIHKTFVINGMQANLQAMKSEMADRLK
jgi:hypothetical protein